MRAIGLALVSGCVVLWMGCSNSPTSSGGGGTGAAGQSGSGAMAGHKGESDVDAGDGAGGTHATHHDASVEDVDASAADGGKSTNDAGADAGNDASLDAGADAGTNASLDAGADAGTDAGGDAAMPFECDPGTQDNDGDLVCEADCSSITCVAHASCDDGSGMAHCLCDDGYQDYDGNGTCMAACAITTCEAGTACHDGTGTALCACLEGYQDKDNDQTCTPDCAHTGCAETCDDSNGIAVCGCAIGTGCALCSTDYQDNDGNGSCLASCSITACGGHAACDDSAGTAVCTCDPGYQDHDHDGACTVNCAYAGLTCGAYSACSDTSGTAKCVCSAGYQDNDEDGTCTQTCASAALVCGTTSSCVDDGGIARCTVCGDERREGKEQCDFDRAALPALSKLCSETCSWDPSLVLWLDAQDVYNDGGESQPAENEALFTWVDKADGRKVIGHSAPSGYDYRPNYTASGIHGLPAVSFWGASIFDVDLDIRPSIRPSITVFALYTTSSRRGSPTGVWSNGERELRAPASFTYGGTWDGVNDVNAGMTTYSEGVPYLVTEVLQQGISDGSTFRVDGTLVHRYTDNHLSDGQAHMSLGSLEGPTGAGNGNTLMGMIGEIMVFSRALSETEEVELGSMLSKMYGMDHYCGDGVREGYEECDKGIADNVGGYEGCKSDCTRDVRCGDGYVNDASEECDEGDKNTASGTYGCTLHCKHLAKYCGDGDLSNGESCDQGTDNLSAQESFICHNVTGNCPYGSCSSACEYAGAYCGNGQIDDASEQCDHGVADNTNSGAYNTCSTTCAWAPAYCGDNVVSNGEQCDVGTGNFTYESGYGCATGCVYGTGGHCGDGITNGSEECDDGPGNTASGDYGCTASCTRHAKYCGDAMITDGEVCDNGGFNTADPTFYNGCTMTCQHTPTYCGDGHIDPGETCDDGDNNTDSGAYGTCSKTCQQGPHCGDGYVNGPEECDGSPGGGANADGLLDGCTSQCKLSALLVWLDASDPGCGDAPPFHDDGWCNRARFAPASQYEVNKQPQLTAAAVGGKPAYHFDGFDDYFYLQEMNIDASVRADLTVITVYQNDAGTPATQSGASLWGQGQGGSDDRFWSTGGNSAYGVSSGISVQAVTGADAEGVALIATVSLRNGAGAGTSKAYVNGALVASFAESHGGTGDTQMLIGRTASGNSFTTSSNFDGYVAEVLVFDRVLSDVERQTVEAELAFKYGL